LGANADAILLTHEAKKKTHMDKKQLKIILSREILIFSVVMLVGILVAKVVYGISSGKDANLSGLILHFFCQLIRSFIWAINRIFIKA